MVMLTSWLKGQCVISQRSGLFEESCLEHILTFFHSSVLLRQHHFPGCVPGDWRARTIISCNVFSCLLTSQEWQWWEKLACCVIMVLNLCTCLIAALIWGGPAMQWMGTSFLLLSVSLWLWKVKSPDGEVESPIPKSRPCNGSLAKTYTRNPELKEGTGRDRNPGDPHFWQEGTVEQAGRQAFPSPYSSQYVVIWSTI